MSTKKNRSGDGIKPDFNVVEVIEGLLGKIKERSADILRKRYGLGEEKITLQKIGDKYRITRERARQIQKQSINKIRNSSAYDEVKEIREKIIDLFDRLGHIVADDDIDRELNISPSELNYFRFLLDVVDGVNFQKEDDYYKSRWHINSDVADRVHKVVYDLYHNISPNDLLTGKEVIEFVKNHPEVLDIKDRLTEDNIKRWVGISKKIALNPMGYWGHVDSPSIRLRGLKDYAYMVMKQHGSPMHFAEVAEAISRVKGVEVHRATVHNELIKDPRFILVGRGMYALVEWGYRPGVVKDVIADILKSEGPLSKDEIIEKVLKERYLKKNTIMVNLQSNPEFKRDEFGRYYYDPEAVK